MFKRIVVANDGSVGGFKALALACDIAKRAGTALHMISVEVLPNMPASIDEVIEAKTDENHKFHDVLAKARDIAKKRASSSTPRWSPATPCRPSSPMSRRTRPICSSSASWGIRRSTSASSAAPPTAWCGWHPAQCWW